ncbi:MAG TPA: hypothetical protein VHL30_01570, partial [Chlamydiales bacterium]|nr:hypothetical protein [Chlamydiales bacterium]
MAKLKKVLSITLYLLPLFFVGCGREFRAESSDRKKILCTIAQIGALAPEIGGKRVEVQVLVRGELNP